MIVPLCGIGLLISSPVRYHCATVHNNYKCSPAWRRKLVLKHNVLVSPLSHYFFCGARGPLWLLLRYFMILNIYKTSIGTSMSFKIKPQIYQFMRPEGRLALSRESSESVVGHTAHLQFCNLVQKKQPVQRLVPQAV